MSHCHCVTVRCVSDNMIPPLRKLKYPAGGAQPLPVCNSAVCQWWHRLPAFVDKFNKAIVLLLLMTPLRKLTVLCWSSAQDYESMMQVSLWNNRAFSLATWLYIICLFPTISGSAIMKLVNSAISTINHLDSSINLTLESESLGLYSVQQLRGIQGPYCIAWISPQFSGFYKLFNKNS